MGSPIICFAKLILFFLNRNPYLRIIIFVTCPLRIFVCCIVHFDTVSCRKFIFRQCRKPFGKYFCIYILQRLWKRTFTGENCPCKSRDCSYGKSFRNIYRRMINICNQIFKLFSSHLRINIDSEHSANVFSVSGSIVLLPV